ncbi:MAG: IS66 family insertion sequence element accessory protein TnpB [Pirellulaceae bacterium]
MVRSNDVKRRFGRSATPGSRGVVHDHVVESEPIFLCTEPTDRPTDMRRGSCELSAIIREEKCAVDPTDGSLFLFVNRRRDRMKLLHFADGGFWLCYRLLEAVTLEMLASSDG